MKVRVDLNERFPKITQSNVMVQTAQSLTEISVQVYNSGVSV